VAKRLTKLGQRIIGLKATTLAPVDQRSLSSRLGLHAEQCQKSTFGVLV
jgi:hypothetical protein